MPSETFANRAMLLAAAMSRGWFADCFGEDSHR